MIGETVVDETAVCDQVITHIADEGASTSLLRNLLNDDRLLDLVVLALLDHIGGLTGLFLFLLCRLFNFGVEVLHSNLNLALLLFLAIELVDVGILDVNYIVFGRSIL